MTDHKFEPFQQVLARNSDDEKWKADFYSHHRTENWPHECAGDVYKQCIPYTPETAHLLGTSQPYEPPKPPVEYEWGQKVEVNQGDSRWKVAMYIAPTRDNDEHWCTKKESPYTLSVLKSANIRPLPDTTADTVKCGICGKPINERTAANDVECGPCCPEHYEDDTAAKRGGFFIARRRGENDQATYASRRTARVG